MTGSASQDGQGPIRANQQADGAPGPTSSLIIAAVAHAGVFAWKLSDTGALPALRLPFGNLIAVSGAGGLLLIFLIAAFGQRGSLSFVVVPAMIVAGVAAHAASAVLLPRQAQLQVLTGVLGFGALSVALTLSFGAAAIASRVAPPWNEAPFTSAKAFRFGAIALAAVLAFTSSLGVNAPIVLLCSVVGLIVFGAMLTSIERDRRGSAMAELVSAFALSLGACWVATIVAGAATLTRVPHEWETAQLAMRYAWLTAMPLVLAAVVGILPRVTAVGLGVKRGLSTVLATVIGALTCAGLGQVVLIQSAPSLLRPSVLAASATPPRRAPAHATPSPSATRLAKPQTGLTMAALPTTNGTPVASTSSSPLVAPAPTAGTAEEALFQESEQARLTLAVEVDGPMLLKDAKAGSQKTMKRLLKCYEKHGPEGEPTDLKLELSIDEVGSVKQVDVLEGKDLRDKYTTCIQMAFYRSGFSGGLRKSLVQVALAFAPKG